MSLELLKEMNTTYSNKFYQGKLNIKYKISFDDLENNKTQQLIKNDFEKLLPRYLQINNLFKDIFKWEEYSDIDTKLFFKTILFFKVSLSYINYLDNKNDSEFGNLVLSRNFDNLNLIDDRINFLISYIPIVKFYKNLSLSNFKYTEQRNHLLSQNKIEINKTIKLIKDDYKESTSLIVNDSEFDTYATEMALSLFDYEVINKDINQIKKKYLLYHSEYYNDFLKNLTLQNLDLITKKIHNTTLNMDNKKMKDRKYIIDYMGNMFASIGIPYLGVIKKFNTISKEYILFVQRFKEKGNTK